MCVLESRDIDSPLSHCCSRTLKSGYKVSGKAYSVVRNLIKSGLVLLSVAVVGCGTIPMGVDPLPYFAINSDEDAGQAVETTALCLLYRTYGFVRASEECDGEWQFEYETDAEDQNACSGRKEGNPAYEVKARLTLRRGSEQIHEVTANIEDPGSESLSASQQQGARRRNELQHTILGLATNECNEYKKTLAERSTSGVLATSAVALLLSAGTGIAGGESTTQGLAAAAGALTGISGLLEQRYTGDLTPALTGIEIARTRIFRQILGSQQKDICEYPVSRAVNDAIRYHSVCNLVEGVAEVSKSLAEELERVGASNSGTDHEGTEQSN